MSAARRGGEALDLKLLTGRHQKAAAQAWREVEAMVPGRHVVASWAWVETWLEHYGRVVPHRFAVATSPAGPRGVALIPVEARRRGPLRVRTLHLGTAAEPEGERAYACYNQLLAAPGEEGRFALALAERLGRERRWDELMVDRFAPEAVAPLTAAFEGLELEAEEAPTVDLHAARDHDGQVLATLRSRTRQQTRRSMRALGELTTEVAETAAAAESIFDELVELHQRRWTVRGEPGVFASERFTGFHRDLMRRLLPERGVMLFRVRSASATVGCVYNVIDGDRVLSHLQGLMPFEGDDRKLKPGFVTHVLCMQACFERGYAEYDLLPEASPYKLELSNSVSEVVSGRLVRQRPGMLLVEQGRRTKRFVKERLGRRMLNRG